MTLWDEKPTIIKPMLAFPSEPFDSKDYIFEIKYDGTRCISYISKDTWIFLNRRGFFFQNRYPEFKKINEWIKASKVILDGEIVILDKGKPNFKFLQEREQTNELRANILADIMPATYYIFDILHLDGKDLVDLPLIERKKILGEIVKENERVKIVGFVEEKGKELFEFAKKEGLEGIMAKQKESVYEQRRSWSWRKIKTLKTADVVILGYTKGEGERDLGAIIVGAYLNGKLVCLGKVGTGFDKQEIEHIEEFARQNPGEKVCEDEAVWCKPKLVCEVRFMEITPDYKLRAPAFIRFREDKSPEDCDLSDVIESVSSNNL